VSGHRGTFRQISELVESDSVISGDKFLSLAKGSGGEIHYFKRDFLFRSGVWRGQAQNSAFELRKDLKGKILLIGHSAIGTGRLAVSLLNGYLRVKGIFGTNLSPKPDISQPIPLGITNSGADGPLHHLLGDSSLMFMADKQADFQDRFEPTIFANYTLDNNSRERSGLARQLRKLPTPIKVIASSPEFTKQGRLRYLRNCRTSGFVVCPEGTGVDTHRLWETLYMGGVPIVRSHPYLRPLISKLPVVQIRDWSELANVSMLEEQWHKIQQLQWDKSLLSYRYWANKITESS